jgi:hypothetical protein
VYAAVFRTGACGNHLGGVAAEHFYGSGFDCFLCAFSSDTRSIRLERRKIMTKLQKQAWLYLFVIVVVCPLLTALSTLVCVTVIGIPLSITLVTQAFAPCTMIIFLPLALNALYVVRKPKQWKGIYPYDERDQLIHYKALLYVFYTLCTVFIIGYIVTPGAVGQIKSIPFYILPLCFSGLAVLIVLVYSVAVLIQYSRGGNDGDK